MKHAVLLSAGALVIGGALWMFLGNAEKPAEPVTEIAAPRPENVAVPAPPPIRPASVRATAVVSVAGAEATEQAAVQAPIKPVAMVRLPGDAGPGAAFFAGQLDTFLKEARLSNAQYEQLAGVLYDAQLNWRAAWQTATHEIIHERGLRDAGGSVFGEARRSLNQQTAGRVAKFLTAAQMEKYEEHVKGMEADIADSMNFVAESGKVLPTP